MFPLHLTIVFLVALGVYGQSTDLNNSPANNQEKGYPFGKLRLSQDGKTEEIIPPTNNVLPPINKDQSAGNGQPLPSPCIGARPSTKLAYPREKSKYILCRDEYHYEIFTCPNGGDYNEQTGTCTTVAPSVDRCELEKPCLYDGQCISLTNSTFKCVCRPEWTGDRCELPLNSCSKKPCGPGAECRPLKTNDFEQDYVCICHAKRGYGLSCQEVVPNPCLKSTEQFFPYAFSSHAYIQCDGELVYFQPCGSLLYWNQEEKICDRKRPNKIEMPTLLAKLTTNNIENKQEQGKEIIVNNEITTTTPKPVEQQNISGQTGQKVAESSSNFVSGQVETRPQLPTNLNNQQGLLAQPVLTNQIRSDFVPQTQQWSSQGQQQGTGANSLGSNIGQTQFGKNNEQQQQQQQTFGQRNQGFSSQLNQGVDSQRNQGFGSQQNQRVDSQRNQGFGSQHWLNSVPISKSQTNEKISTPVEPWRKFDSQSGQINSQNLNQQSVGETTGKESNVFRLQGSRTGNTQGEEQSWQTRPTTQLVQPQTWQLNSQSTQNQHIPTMTLVDGKSLDNQNRLSTNLQSNTQFGLGQQNLLERNQASSGSKWSGSTSDMKTANQQFGTQTQPSWSGSTTIFSHPQFQDQNQQTISGSLSATQNINRLPSSQNLNTQEQVVAWQSRPVTQLSTNQLPQTTHFNAPPSRTVDGPQQSWQRFESRTGQSNQQPIADTSATGSNIFRSQDLQTLNTQDKSKSWQTKSTGSTTENRSSQTDDSIALQTRAMEDQPQQSWRRFESPTPSEHSQNSNQQSLGANRFVGQNLQTTLTPQSTQTWETSPTIQLPERQAVAIPDKLHQSWRRFESAPPPRPPPQNSNQQSLSGMTDEHRVQGSQNLNRVDSFKPLQANTFQTFKPRALEESQQTWRRVESPTNEQTSQNQNFEVKSQSKPVLAFQPKAWSDSKSTQQENILTSQNPNNQIGFNQPQTGASVQNSFDSKSWLSNQQFPTQGGHELATTNDMNTASNQNFVTRPVQPSLTQGLRNWQLSQTSQDNNQLTSTDQRKF